MKRHGFTLVELSIVLVILGLLVGGVLSGQSLIHAAELRSINREYAQHTTAVYAFRDKYQALPGDMPNAVKFWGAMDDTTNDGADSDCAAFQAAGVASSGTNTCNGNGNGRVTNAFDSAGNSLDTNDASYETLLAWQHLSNAGLIEGNYRGVWGDGAGGDYQTAGFNVPGSKFPSAVWKFYFSGLSRFNPVTQSQIALCIERPVDETPCGMPLFVNEDAYNIDRKMDDGVPLTGKVVASHPRCTTDPSFDTSNGPIDPTLRYDVAQPDENCALVMMVQ